MMVFGDGPALLAARICLKRAIHIPSRVFVITFCTEMGRMPTTSPSLLNFGMATSLCARIASGRMEPDTLSSEIAVHTAASVWARAIRSRPAVSLSGITSITIPSTAPEVPGRRVFSASIASAAVKGRSHTEAGALSAARSSTSDVAYTAHRRSLQRISMSSSSMARYQALSQKLATLASASTSMLARRRFLLW